MITAKRWRDRSQISENFWVKTQPSNPSTSTALTSPRYHELWLLTKWIFHSHLHIYYSFSPHFCTTPPPNKCQFVFNVSVGLSISHKQSPDLLHIPSTHLHMNQWISCFFQYNTDLIPTDQTYEPQNFSFTCWNKIKELPFLYLPSREFTSVARFISSPFECLEYYMMSYHVWELRPGLEESSVQFYSICPYLSIQTRFKEVVTRSMVDALSELCSPFLKGATPHLLQR